MSSNVLGEGSYGSVHLGMNEAGRLVAIKALPIGMRRPGGAFSSGSERDEDTQDMAADAQDAREGRRERISWRRRRRQDRKLDTMSKEIRMLCELNHDNVVDYLGSQVVQRTLLIVMEYVAGGSLATLLRHFGTLSPSCTAQYCRHILKGLQYLHSNDVAHLDVKPANVLIGEHGCCKLADFGTASQYNTSVGIPREGGMDGTPVYMAPEAAEGRATMESDIWSVGMTCLELLTGAYGWQLEPHAHRLQVLEHIKNPTNRPHIPDSLPVLARAFLCTALQFHAALRASAEELLLDAFLL